MEVVKTVLVPLSTMVLSLVRLLMPLRVVRLVVHSDAWAVVTVWKHVNSMQFTLIRKQAFLRGTKKSVQLVVLVPRLVRAVSSKSVRRVRTTVVWW